MPQPEKKKFNYFNLITFVIAIGIIVYYALSDPDVKNLGSLIIKFEPLYILALLLCTAMYIISDGGILYVGCDIFPGKMNFLHSIKVALVGAYYSALTPFASGGQPMQVVYMKKWNVPTSASSSIFVLAFFFWHIVMSIFAIIGFIYYKSMLVSHVGMLIACIVGILICLLCVLAGFLILFNVNFRPLVFFFVRILEKIKIIKNQEKVDESINKWIDDFREAFVILRKYPKDMIKMFFLTILKLVSYSSVTYILYRGFGLSGQSFISILLLQVLLSATVSFVPIPGASGASEGVFYILFSTIFTNGTAFPAMLLWRAFTYYIFLLVGIAINFFDGVNDFKVKFKKKDIV